MNLDSKLADWCYTSDWQYLSFPGQAFPTGWLQMWWLLAIALLRYAFVGLECFTTKIFLQLIHSEYQNLRGKPHIGDDNRNAIASYRYITDISRIPYDCLENLSTFETTCLRSWHSLSLWFRVAIEGFASCRVYLFICALDTFLAPKASIIRFGMAYTHQFWARQCCLYPTYPLAIPAKSCTRLVKILYVYIDLHLFDEDNIRLQKDEKLGLLTMFRVTTKFDETRVWYEFPIDALY